MLRLDVQFIQIVWYFFGQMKDHPRFSKPTVGPSDSSPERTLCANSDCDSLVAKVTAEIGSYSRTRFELCANAGRNRQDSTALENSGFTIDNIFYQQ